MLKISSKISLCMRFLCLLVILSANTSPCQGLERLCGNRLSDALALICENGFGSKTKKSIDPVDYYLNVEDDLQSEIENTPFLSKRYPNSISYTRRRRFGVYDECCRKPCTRSELRSYCL